MAKSRRKLIPKKKKTETARIRIPLLKSSASKRRLGKIFSGIVIIIGIAVMLGWIFNIPLLKSISPNWISMKFDTAFCFVLSGITLYYIIRSIEGDTDLPPIILSMTALIIMLLMGTLFISDMIGIHSGAESVFIKDTNPSSKTVIPGMPAFPTMISFLLVGLAGILTILNLERSEIKVKIIGLIIAIIGGLAILGYVFNTPVLYYFVAGIGSAMAFHTAVLFVLLGVGLLCL